MVGFLRKAIAAFMVIFVFSSGNVSVNKMEVKNPDNILLNVSIISDGHMEGNNKARFERHGKAMLDFSSAETPVDALVMVGDNTMNAQMVEYFILYGMMRKYLTVDNVLITPGNHELRKTDEYEKYYKRFMVYNKSFFDYDEEHAYFSRDINGYKFIVLATEKDSKIQEYLSAEQLNWLQKELDSASDSGKSVFVFNHFQLADKFKYDWDDSDVGEQGEKLDSIMKSCDSRVFYFSGHLHMGVYENGNGLATEDNVTYVNVPGFGEECLYGDVTDPGMGWQMEVYENELILRLRNFSQGKWVDGYEYKYKL
ncbi:MAG: metallophosphoesterase [Clostridiales bacterium]|nr:metallophosphoesterase [Clostridiales bacterium]